MKKLKFAMLFLLITGTLYSQAEANSSEKKYLSKSIWSQVLNDFEGSLTIPVITPWVIGVGTYNYIKSDVFTKNSMKEQDVFSVKNLKYDEITNSVKTLFINFIPKDSAMRMRAVYKNRVLYNYDISKTDSTVQIEFGVPAKNNGETAVFDKKGRLLTFNNFNEWQATNIKSLQLSDTVSVYSNSNTGSENELIEKRQFRNGCLIRESTMKKNLLTSKESFVSDVISNYDKESKLISRQFLNKKGSVTDSVIYYYNDQGKVFMILQQGEKTSQKRIVYDYQQLNVVVKKLRLTDIEYTITHTSPANRLAQISFNESDYTLSSSYTFEYNSQGLLMTVSEFSSAENMNDTAAKKQYIFSYNENNNIKKVTVINSTGVITKEINFEYDYL